MKITTEEKRDLLYDKPFRFYDLEGVPQHFPDFPGISLKNLAAIANIKADRFSIPKIVGGEIVEVVYERRPNDFHYTDDDGVEAIIRQRVWRRVA